MKDFKQIIKQYANKNLDERKSWYSSVAEAYNKVRPGYSQDTIHSVVELAQLPCDGAILEIGCGPGTATVGFAELGYEMLCLEPSQEAYKFARKNCGGYANVEIKNICLEEWEVEKERFDAVLAASSIHWIPPEVAYPKAADALKKSGSLILLWNTKLEPEYEVYQALEEVYQTYAPSLAEFRNPKNEVEELKKFGQIVLDSGRFKDVIYEESVCQVNYSINDYLNVLSTYSQYIQLDTQTRNSLFAGLKTKIQQHGETINLSYLSSFHVARKV